MSAPRSAGEATEVVELIIDRDERVGAGGFLELRRVRLRNRRSDGSASAQYGCEFIERSYGQDAVVVVLYRRRRAGDDAGQPGRAVRPARNDEVNGAENGEVNGAENGGQNGEVIEVLLRDGLRPALWLGRDPQRAPLPEPAPGLFHRELVAGILEHHDRGRAGLLRRAAAESLEEAGAAIAPERFQLLGAGALPSPGAMLEKFYFAAAELTADIELVPCGDGSPMEDDARLHWLELDAAIAACVSGELTDAKTELGLRRLRDALRVPTLPSTGDRP
jgi:ADP-ribose pyrophosphatase